jgi:hypothetical protein
MYRIVSGITTLLQYIGTLLSKPEVFHPQQCPLCGFGCLWKHGFYFRKANRCPIPGEEHLHMIPISRYLCTGCRHTCSRLPSCIPPRRWYSWLSQQEILLFMLATCCLHGCSVKFSMCRSTVRRWWKWLKSRTSIFEFTLRSRFPEWGRFIDFISFWIGAMGSMPLSEMMAQLDNDGMTIP